MSTVKLALAAVCLAACSHAWDDLVPLGNSSPASSSASSSSSSGDGGAGGMAGQGGSAGAGGMAGAGGGGGAGGSGGGGPVRCGGTNLLGTDYFYKASPASYEKSNGDLTLDPATGEGIMKLMPSQFIRVYTARHYDLRDDAVSLKILELPMNANRAGLELGYGDSDDSRIFLRADTLAEPDILRCGYEKTSGLFNMHQKIYDPVTDVHIQLRESDNQIFCETSPDGITYTSFGSFPLAMVQSIPPIVQVTVVAKSPSSPAPSGQFRFDELRGGPVGPSGASWCPLSSFSDDFSSNSARVEWRTFADDTGSFSQANMQLDLTCGTVLYDQAYYMTRAAFDMTGQAITVKVLDVPPPTTPTDEYVMNFVITRPDSSTSLVGWLGFDLREDSITVKTRVQGNNSSNLGSSFAPPPLPYWLRMSQILSNNILFEVGTLKNGVVEWSQHGSVPATDYIDLQAVVPQLRLSNSDTGGKNTTVSFDDFNIPPP